MNDFIFDDFSTIGLFVKYKVINIRYLINWIIVGCSAIRNISGVFERVHESKIRRLYSCMLTGDSYFQ